MAVRPAFSLTAREIDYIEPASNYKCNTPNTDDAINSLILKSHSDDSPALIVVKGLGSDLFNNQTEFLLRSEDGRTPAFAGLFCICRVDQP